MLCSGKGAAPGSAAALVGQFALVSYIPEPLAGFLDRLRLELTPGCNPHAHVTVLPPRPLAGDLKETIHCLASHCRDVMEFHVRLGDIEVFPVSNVIYLNLRFGSEELQSIYRKLNAGSLCCPERYPYHPHITLAQHLGADVVGEAAEVARRRWAEYRGTREFAVETLTFVQQVAPEMWVDLAEVSLAAGVMAGAR